MPAAAHHPIRSETGSNRGAHGAQHCNCFLPQCPLCSSYRGGGCTKLRESPNHSRGLVCFIFPFFPPCLRFPTDPLPCIAGGEAVGDCISNSGRHDRSCQLFHDPVVCRPPGLSGWRWPSCHFLETSLRQEPRRRHLDRAGSMSTVSAPGDHVGVQGLGDQIGGSGGCRGSEAPNLGC